MNKKNPADMLSLIANIVSKHTGVPADDLYRRGRLGNVVIARFIVIENLMEKLPLLSPVQLAEMFGRSVGWARFAVKQEIIDSRFKKIKSDIQNEIQLACK